MSLESESYFSLRTKKKDGSFVDTPVWFVRAPEAHAYYVFANINSGKVKRIRNFAEVAVAVCDWRGKILGSWLSARAELVAESEGIYAGFGAKNGLTYRVFDFFSRLGGKRKERQIILVSHVAE